VVRNSKLCSVVGHRCFVTKQDNFCTPLYKAVVHKLFDLVAQFENTT